MQPQILYSPQILYPPMYFILRLILLRMIIHTIHFCRVSWMSTYIKEDDGKDQWWAWRSSGTRRRLGLDGGGGFFHATRPLYGYTLHIWYYLCGFAERVWRPWSNLMDRVHTAWHYLSLRYLCGYISFISCSDTLFYRVMLSVCHDWRNYETVNTTTTSPFYDTYIIMLKYIHFFGVLYHILHAYYSRTELMYTVS